MVSSASGWRTKPIIKPIHFSDKLNKYVISVAAEISELPSGAQYVFESSLPPRTRGGRRERRGARGGNRSIPGPFQPESSVKGGVSGLRKPKIHAVRRKDARHGTSDYERQAAFDRHAARLEDREKNHRKARVLVYGESEVHSGSDKLLRQKRRAKLRLVRYCRKHGLNKQHFHTIVGAAWVVRRSRIREGFEYLSGSPTAKEVSSMKATKESKFDNIIEAFRKLRVVLAQEVFGKRMGRAIEGTERKRKPKRGDRTGRGTTHPVRSNNLAERFWDDAFTKLESLEDGEDVNGISAADLITKGTGLQQSLNYLAGIDRDERYGRYYMEDYFDKKTKTWKQRKVLVPKWAALARYLVSHGPHNVIGSTEIDKDFEKWVKEKYNKFGQQMTVRQRAALKALALMHDIELNPGPGKSRGGVSGRRGRGGTRGRGVRASRGNGSHPGVKGGGGASSATKQLVAVAQADEKVQQQAAFDSKLQKMITFLESKADDFEKRCEDLQEDMMKKNSELDKVEKKVKEQAAIISDAQKLGFIAEEIEVDYVYSFHGRFNGLDSTFAKGVEGGSGADPIVTVAVTKKGDWISTADGVTLRMHVPRPMVDVAQHSVGCSDPNRRMTNIYNGLLTAKEVKETLSAEGYAVALDRARSMMYVAFLLTGLITAVGRCRWMNDCAEWVVDKYIVKPPPDWRERLKGVNLAADSLKFQSETCRNSRAAPYVLEGVIPYVPDASDWGTLISALCKRLYPDLPPRTNSMRRKIRKCAIQLAKEIVLRWDAVEGAGAEPLTEDQMENVDVTSSVDEGVQSRFLRAEEHQEHPVEDDGDDSDSDDSDSDSDSDDSSDDSDSDDSDDDDEDDEEPTTFAPNPKLDELFEKAMEGRPQYEVVQIRKGFQMVKDNPDDAIRYYCEHPYKCFIKLESYPDGSLKPPRFIMCLPLDCRGIQMAFMLQVLHVIEVGTKECNVKGLTADQITELLKTKFEAVPMVAETDFSSFESCIDPDLKFICENLIYKLIGQNLPNGRLILDFIERALDRKTVRLVGPVFTITKFHHIRMSGDLWTSLGNLVTNIVIQCVCNDVSVVKMMKEGLFEGDDGAYPAPQNPDLVKSRAVNCGVKLTFDIAPWESLSFCGNHFEMVDGELRRFKDPLKVAANLSILFNAPRQTLKFDRMLQRSKHIAYLEGSIIPDAFVFSAVVERFTRDARVSESRLLSMGLLKSYSGFALEKCVPDYLIHDRFGNELTDDEFVDVVYLRNLHAGGTCSKKRVAEMVAVARKSGVSTHVVLPSPIEVTTPGTWYARDGSRFTHQHANSWKMFSLPYVAYNDRQTRSKGGKERHLPLSKYGAVEETSGTKLSHFLGWSWKRLLKNLWPLIPLFFLSFILGLCSVSQPVVQPIEKNMTPFPHDFVLNQARDFVGLGVGVPKPSNTFICDSDDVCTPYEFDLKLSLPPPDYSFYSDFVTRLSQTGDDVKMYVRESTDEVLTRLQAEVDVLKAKLAAREEQVKSYDWSGALAGFVNWCDRMFSLLSSCLFGLVDMLYDSLPHITVREGVEVLSKLACLIYFAFLTVSVLWFAWKLLLMRLRHAVEDLLLTILVILLYLICFCYVSDPTCFWILMTVVFLLEIVVYTRHLVERLKLDLMMLVFYCLFVIIPFFAARYLRYHLKLMGGF